MAFKPGKGAFILMDGVAGTGVDISAYADDFSFDQNIDTHDVSVFGAAAHTNVAGLTDGGCSMSGPVDVALGTFIGGIVGQQGPAGSTTSTLVYGPGGSVSGQIKQQAEVWVTAYSVNTSVGGRAEYSCSLQIDGAVTNGTW